MHNILLAGAGQLGSRYLQGLSEVSEPLFIYVLDISSESLLLAERRWHEVVNKISPVHQVVFTKEYTTIPENIEIAIVSTGASIRSTVVKKITDHTVVSYWIIEKVLAQNSLEIDEIRQSIKGAKGAWINTPRRIMEWHQDIKSKLNTQSAISLNVTGGKWGLACNAIHFLDLLSWWTGERIDAVDCSHLQSWFESKRKDFYEVSGKLVAHFSGGSMVVLSDLLNEEPVNIKLEEQGYTWDINEAKGIANRSDGVSVNGVMLLQSKLTKLIIEDILNNGRCNLPSFEESAALHVLLLNMLISHWNVQNNTSIVKLPIT